MVSLLYLECIEVTSFSRTIHQSVQSNREPFVFFFSRQSATASPFSPSLFPLSVHRSNNNNVLLKSTAKILFNFCAKNSRMVSHVGLLLIVLSLGAKSWFKIDASSFSFPPLFSFGKKPAALLSSCLASSSSSKFSSPQSASSFSSVGATSSSSSIDLTSGATTSTGRTPEGIGETKILADDPEFLKPERDRRRYRIIQLANNLKVMLISGGTSEENVGIEAASVHVQAGHFDDTIPGLAHFHEHLLFLGTEKYPGEDEYENFLSENGGFSNAYTDMEDTNYYFSVTTENEDSTKTTQALEGALDRLAQFFVAPLFDPDAADRECKAIDSEYKNGITSDAWRNFQFLKSVGNPKHPFANFGCGNYETLTSQGFDTLIDSLKKFWKDYYQSYNLRLAVLGHADLDALQKTVEKTFGQLPYSKGESRYVKDVPGQEFTREGAITGLKAFEPEHLGKIQELIPLTESRSIKIFFSTPPLDDPKLRKTKPYRAISHILGHESPGSLHALLSDMGYLSSLSSGIAVDSSDFSLFSLTLSLTKEGMKNKDQVLDLAWQWISLIRKNEDKVHLYHDELTKLSAINFRFRENGDPTDFCSSASEVLFQEMSEPSRILFATSETQDYDPEITKSFMNRLNPRNCIVSILDPDLDEKVGAWRQEKWYGAKFRSTDISEDQLHCWNFPNDIDSRLTLPGLNEYLPADFSLRADEHDSSDEELDETEIDRVPEIVIDRNNLRLWHKMDKFWRIPKSFIRLSLMTPNVYRSPRTMTHNRIFQRVLDDDLNSFLYDASVAGCNYRVSCVPDGWRISVRGYSEKLPFLLNTVISRIWSLVQEMQEGNEALRDKFEKAKQGLLRETKNFRLDAPNEVANYNSRLLIEESVWYLDNYIDEMEGPFSENDPLVMEECGKVIEECIGTRVKAEALCMGNIDMAGVEEVDRLISESFLDKGRPLHEVEIPKFRSMKVPTREEAKKIFGDEAGQRLAPIIYQELAFSESEENNAVEMIYQVGSELDLGYQGLAALDLISHMSYTSAFAQLRTKEQLGYIVSSFARKTTGGCWGLSVVVQSSVAVPDELERRIESWIEIFRKELEMMSPEKIAMEASSVAAQLKEGETKLSQEVNRYWGEILNTEGLSERLRKPAFDRLEKLAFELAVSDEEGEGRYENAQELKDYLLEFFDEYFAPSSPSRRLLSSRVYSQRERDTYERSLKEKGVLASFEDMRHVKQYLSTWPVVPYWSL